MKTLRAYIVTRVLLTIPMLFVLVTLVFFVVRIMPGDPVEAMLRPGVPKEYKDQIKHNLGLDRPLFLNLRGSTARVKPETLFLQTEPGSGGARSLRVERGAILDIGDRRGNQGSGDQGSQHDWLQVALPEDFSGWVSPDQMAWMRQVNTEMTILEQAEIEGTETWTLLTAPDAPVGQQVGAIWGEPSGLLWFGTDLGVTRYSATGWDAFEETAGKDVQTAWSDRPADLWFGTDGAGVLRVRSGKWTEITAKDGLASDRVLSIWGRGSRTIWVGTDRGVSLYNGRAWQSYADELPGLEVRAIWGDGQTPSGEAPVWFGTEGGLSRYDGKTWMTVTDSGPPDGLPDKRVRALWGDEDGVLWVGTEGGLARLEGETWTTYSDAPVHSINCIFRAAASSTDASSAADGPLWVGTQEGVGVYDGQSWTTYTTADGLADNDVRAIWQDASGNLWVGTRGGLNRLDNRPWIKLRVPEGGLEGWAPVEQFDIRINPFDSQYFNYLWDLVRLDLGVSLAPTRGRPVIRDLKAKFPATLELSISSLIITVLIGIPAGAFAAHKRRSVADYGFRIFSIVIWAVPVFWLGIMFQLVFGVYLGEWYETSSFARQVLQPIFGDFLPLPISGRIGTEMAPRTITGLYFIDSLLTGNLPAVKSTVRYLVLPSVTLGLYLSGVFVRLTRSNMLDTLKEDYITAARARGIKERVVVYGHALKNAFIPILTMMGLQFAALLAGAVLTETTFSWPGMGLFMWERIGYRDFNSIQGSVVFFALLVAAVSLIVDIIYAWIDPRIRY
jgi:peptide/nickel transport system permease protein